MQRFWFLGDNCLGFLKLVELSWVGGEGGAPWTQIKWGPEGWGPKGVVARRVGAMRVGRKGGGSKGGGPNPEKVGARREGAEGWGPEGWSPEVGGPKFSRFFFLSRRKIRSFLPSLWFSWNFGGV